jgi:hypothetical protein
MNGTGGISNVSKVIIVAVIAAVLIILVIVYGTQNGVPTTTADNNSSSTSVALTATSPAETANTISATPKSPAAPATPVITFVTPVANDIWTIGNQNPIAWSIAPNVSGAISLLSATTGKSIGVILPEIGPKQTSYAWNTRDVFLDRSDPQKTDVIPGTYKIEVSFDGNNLKPITSPAFTITN